MTNSNLANAPLIDTDIPTSDAWYNQAVASGSGTVVDINRRYLLSGASCSILAMDNVPNGFGLTETQKGIVAIFSTANYDGTNSVRVAMHKPTASIRDYVTGWDVLPGMHITISENDPNSDFAGGGAVASQRQGQYAYVFLHDVSDNLFTSSANVTVYKVTRDEYVEIAGVSGGFQILDGESTDGAFPHISALDGGQFFVSDEEQPFIWNVSGTVHSGGTAVMTGFRDDNSQNIGYTYTQGISNRHDLGQSAAFYQTVALPAGSYGFGPYLVNTWAGAAYGPPELWYVLYDFDSSGNTTGLFKVYRSTWKKGAYLKPDFISFADDDDFVAGRTRFPKLNPMGYGWEQDVFNEKHFVSTIGPFGGMAVHNPQPNILANLQNQVNTGTTTFPLASPSALPLVFSVVRDTKRWGVLHMVIADGGSYPTDANVLNRIWYSNSSDDGASWSRITQIGPAIAPASQGTPGNVPGSPLVSRSGIVTKSGLLANETVGYYTGASRSGGARALPVVRTHDDVLLVGNLIRSTTYSFADGSSPILHALPDDAGLKISMAVVDYTGTGTALSDRNTVFYVQKVQAGQIAWQ